MKQLLSLIVISAILATGMLAIGYVQTALADIIDCEGTGTCTGTNDRDTIIGNEENNNILGCGGDDVLVGNDGNDDISGEILFADVECPNGVTPGADKLQGGRGDDIIAHSNSGETSADGHKDIINCGPGDDEVWINTSEDKDVAKNCETVHEG